MSRATPLKHPYVLLLAVIVFWAGNFPLGKLALAELGPVTLTAARALSAAPILVGIAWLTAPLAHPLTLRDYRAFVVLGLTGLVGNTTLWYLGLRQTSALNAGVLGATSPIFVPVTASGLLGDRLHARNWVALAPRRAARLVRCALLRRARNAGARLVLQGGARDRPGPGGRVHEPDALRRHRADVAPGGRGGPRLSPGRRRPGDRRRVPHDAG